MGTTPIYRGKNARTIAMPLGGIGTGQISVCGDGGLRQWEIFNQVNHQAAPSESFFAIRVARPEPPLDILRILQSSPDIGQGRSQTTDHDLGLANDAWIPPSQLRLLERFPGVASTSFSGPYPLANVKYEDPDLPIDVDLTAFSPFRMLDSERSGVPAICFDFTLRNRDAYDVEGVLGSAMQNCVGWDGLIPIQDSSCSLFGGNTNRIRTSPSRLDIVMENAALDDDHPGAGQMVLSAMSPGAIPYERWTRSEDFVRFMEGNLVGRQPFHSTQKYLSMRHYSSFPAIGQGPSPTGRTWNAGLAVPFSLRPGESQDVRLVLAWWFPNRYVNFDQYTWEHRDYGKSRFWLGNAYTERFADAVAVVDEIENEGPGMEAATRAWADELVRSSLSPTLTELMGAQGALIRSPNSFQSQDGKFFGFEGGLGVSTRMWTGDYGGSCPLNCTHVWNYEQALSRWFPDVERTMRETEFEYVQAPEGYIPHRTVVPLYLRQFWDQPIGGPENPAIDGMLGALLKTYREARQGAGIEWVERLWPNIRRLTEYIRSNWDDGDDGVVTGEQPNTFDIHFFGVNTFIGSLWLASLKAVARMAQLVGEDEYAKELMEVFESGSRKYDAALWNGEYYEQILTEEEAALPHQWGAGCLSDQLVGQWWAHQLELGYILPEEHVKRALKSIIKYNWRDDFAAFEHGYRVFADSGDAGLLVCSWPRGGRPEVPLRYADEVWIGSEYQVAAHCLMEGLNAEGMKILEAYWNRHDGDRRNPFNGIECGDHYVRAMAGWSVVEAISGFAYDALLDRLSLSQRMDLRGTFPFVAATAWGTVRRIDGGSVIKLNEGQLPVRQLCVPFVVERVEIDGRSVTTLDEAPFKAGSEILLDQCSVLGSGSELKIVMGN